MMNPKEHAYFEARARIIKAMAHPTRLFILDQLLRRGPRCVCHLTAQVGADTSTVSRHLSVLRDAGLVEDQKRGALVFYRIRARRCVANILANVQAVLEANLETQHKLIL